MLGAGGAAGRALLALGVAAGDEVGIAGLHGLADLPDMLGRAGIVPVFADVDAETLLLAPESVARAVSYEERAPSLPTDTVRRDRTLARRVRRCGAENPTLVEDAAHAAGSTIDGRPVGSHASLTFFSLQGTIR